MESLEHRQALKRFARARENVDLWDAVYAINGKLIEAGLPSLSPTQINLLRSGEIGNVDMPNEIESGDTLEVIKGKLDAQATMIAHLLEADINLIPTFVYRCTGEEDDLAIQNIVNSFFSNPLDTRMAMKLVISGTMGLQAEPENDIYINISATNSKNAACYLDFSDCDIPDIATPNVNFFAVSDYSVRVNVYGMVVRCTGSGVWLEHGNCNTFTDCVFEINGPGNTRGVVICNDSSNNTFNNCIILSNSTDNTGTSYAANCIDNASNNIFNNCMISSTAIISNVAARCAGEASNNKFTNCTITGSGGTTCIGAQMRDSSQDNKFTNCTITGKDGSNNAHGVAFSSVIDVKNNSFVNCDFKGKTYGISLGGGNENKFSNCNAIGGSIGVNITASSDNKFENCEFVGETSHGVQEDENCQDNYYSNCKIVGANRGVRLMGSGNFFINCYISGGAYGVGYTTNVSFVSCKIEARSGSGIGTPVSVGSHGSFTNCIITGTVYGVTVLSTFPGILILNSCKIIGATTGLRVETANTDAEIRLIGNTIKGVSTQDIQQTTAASTVKWFIEGNTFSRATIIVDGTTAISYKTASAHIYFPQYANKFSRTIN